MKTLENWLDEAKVKSGSDYMTAKNMNVTRQAISHARKKNALSNETARKLAEFLDTSPLNIIASVEVDKKPESEKNWSKWVAGIVIASVLGMGNNSYISSTYADSTTQPFIHYTQLVLCVILSVAIYSLLKSLKFGNQVQSH